MTITTCIFDAYGTLFDVDAAARNVAKEPGQSQLAAVWGTLSADWRAKQLEYSWLRAIAGQHIPFWQVTQDALDWALDNNGLHDNALRAKLLSVYKELPAFPEVPAMLKALKEKDVNIAILSNGSPDMLVSAVRSAGIGEYLDDVLSVEEVEIYKPHRHVYDLVWDRFDVPQTEVLFASSNGWDAAGAAGYGFGTVWVNRADKPQDRLWAAPHRTLKDLSTIPDLV
ncbi:2-haloacid dehalogenase [Octadecabacter temperatus]|uniref:(S)-2-haloacid dehalogenase n=1 Tax=Octadecabacter temperatus TaxID=1458307 RepID=A0A0K0Y7Q8_9RHOB|nr:haloacid dehalogenase type II [Octadecabacter temperatus]AKS47009.1 (S)-2-haloacid dehalogenase 4A [Octadecabacter temperatus]SIO25140.1 2-haloacid dehalogenase [Octadecabacter temperatus]